MRIRINLEIWNRILDHFLLRLDALAEVCGLRAQSSFIFWSSALKCARLRRLATRQLLVNPLTSTLKPHSNGPLYNNTVIGTLYIWYSEEGPERAEAPPSPLLAVPNITAHPSTASVPTSYYSMWHYNYLCPLKG